MLHGIESVVPDTAPDFFPAEQRASRYCLQYRQGREEVAAEAGGAGALPSVSLLPLPAGAVPAGDAGGAWQALLAQHGCAATGGAMQLSLGTYEGEGERTAAGDASPEAPRRVLIRCSAGS